MFLTPMLLRGVHDEALASRSPLGGILFTNVTGFGLIN